MASLVNRILLILFGIAVLGSLAYQTLFAGYGHDPHRCRSMLETGRWINPVNDLSPPFSWWQPDGCLLHHYSSAEIRQCFKRRHILFSGDVETRQVAYGIARLLQRDEANWDRQHIPPNAPFNVTYHGVNIQQYPALSVEPDGIQPPRLVEELNLISAQLDHPAPVNGQKAAALALLGTRKMGSVPNDQFRKLSLAVTKESEMIGSSPDYLTAPMSADGPGTQVFFAPPLIHPGGDHEQAASMQHWLREAGSQLNMPVAWAFQEMVQGYGEHVWAFPDDNSSTNVIDTIAETQANILLNLRCNAILDRTNFWIYSRTCCTDFGGQPLTQLATAWVSAVFLILCIAGETADIIARRDTPRFRLFNMQVGGFAMTLVYCFLIDRTQMFSKEMRAVTSYKDMAFFSLPFLVITILTIRKSQAVKSRGTAVEKDQPFLGRDQTDEWKGWMQWCILVWHWCMPVQQVHLEIFIFIRLLVAAYLFQTGYNHTTYFLVKKDFSFRRFMAVTLRLNLLTWALSYLMGAHWWAYYFAPLCTLWFAITWLTMYIGHEKLNDNPQLVLCKITIAAILVALVISRTPFLTWLTHIMRSIFKVHWGVVTVQFRVELDMLITFVGMATAVANCNMKESIQPALRYVLGFAGAVVISLYGYTSYTMPMTLETYKLWHPFVAFIPIFGFIAIRNMNTFFRNYSSRAMIWIGRCSLETYILQTHLYLAGDFQGVLLIDGLQDNSSGFLLGRLKSLLIIMPIFFWVSSQAATGTGALCAIIMDTSRVSNPPTYISLPTYSDKPEAAAEAGEVEGEVVLEDEELLSTSPKPRAPWYASSFRALSKTVDAVFFTLYGRMALMLLGFWVLNVCSPGPDPADVPDGFTPHRVGHV